jgi:hypothetical protein
MYMETMNDDLTLLREYPRCNSEEAFAALVSRHVNLPGWHFPLTHFANHFTRRLRIV